MAAGTSMGTGVSDMVLLTEANTRVEPREQNVREERAEQRQHCQLQQRTRREISVLAFERRKQERPGRLQAQHDRDNRRARDEVDEYVIQAAYEWVERMTERILDQQPGFREAT